MPEAKTIRRARKDRDEGKSASTQAGEFVREQIEHIREGKHGARSTKQAIAIGLSEARRAGVKLPVPNKGKAKEATRTQAKRESRKAQQEKTTSTKGTDPIRNQPVSEERSEASTEALRRESGRAASKSALSQQGKSAARQRTPAERQASARKAAAARRRNAAKSS